MTNQPANLRGLARRSRLHRCCPHGPCPSPGRHPHRKGLRHRPLSSHDFAINSAWLAAALIAATLLAWLRLLALDGDLARAEPKTLRYKILHAAARLTHSGRRHRLKISRTWPWVTTITTAWTRLNALPQAP